MHAKTETLVGLFVLGSLAIFLYMGFKIGSFRFDRSDYNEYTMYFKDVSGLTRKAEVKIAGVTVGWVESVNLYADHVQQAETKVMVKKDFNLYDDARGMVRQDGLLGPKFIELIPGNPELLKLQTGQALREPAISPVSVDELMRKFGHIASNVESITDSLKSVMGDGPGQDQLRNIMENINITAERLASFSTSLEKSFARNEEHIDALLAIGTHVKAITTKLENDVLPAVQEGIEKIANVFDRDFNRVAGTLATTAQSIEQASLQARDGFTSITSVAAKIDEGRGLLGKLVNEEETYRDLKVAVQGLKNYFAKVDTLQIVFDAHGETMHRPAENYRYEDSKFYFDMRIHPNEDHFYLVQLASSEKGWRDERETLKTRFDDCGDILPTDKWIKPPIADADNAPRERVQTFTRNTLKFGLQFGKVFRDLAFRIGLFENTGGVAIDYDIPFESDKFRWVTTFELFDMNGWNRLHDRRPHLKWLNRMFFMRNLYITFGADDFVSKRNANGFVGLGLRFGDDDVKYILPSIGSARGLAG